MYFIRFSFTTTITFNQYNPPNTNETSFLTTLDLYGTVEMVVHLLQRACEKYLIDEFDSETAKHKFVDIVSISKL